MKEYVYTISKDEMNRRISAYTTLIISFLFSLAIFSLEYITPYIYLSICVFTVLTVILLWTRILVIKYFKSIMNNKTVLTKKYIKKNNKEYLISDIDQVRVKRTSGEYIREIKIVLKNYNTFYINGIDDFEDFAKKFDSYLPKDVERSEYYEPINYDHPLFYFFFGILLGIATIEFAKFFITLGDSTLRIIYYILSIGTAILGIYFMVNRPIYKRDGKNNQKTDYIWGLIFIFGALLIFLSYIE